MASTLGIQEPVKRGEKHPYCRKAAPTTRDLDPSSYFPNSFSAVILASWASGKYYSRKLESMKRTEAKQNPAPFSTGNQTPLDTRTQEATTIGPS